MKWKVFATDFDGTIATDGMVDEHTISALQRLREAGVRMALVTGRELKDFVTTPHLLLLFDVVVAENGAVLHIPASGTSRILAQPPPEALTERLRSANIPVSQGHVILATIEPHQGAVLDAIRDLALEYQVIFNKGAVMVLPAGVNKFSGLKAALEDFNIPLAEVIGVGDAENDSAFLEHCGFSVAVANAVPALQAQVHRVTSSNAGAGVAELIESLLGEESKATPA